VDKNAIGPLTFVPPFPIYPPETSWMRQPTSQTAALVLHEPHPESRVAYLPADVDRCFGRSNLPDHGDLLANLVRWTARDRIPLRVEGRGSIDCHLYRQFGRLILHVVGLTGTGYSPVHELIPVGPFRVEIELPEDVSGKRARFLVSEKEADSFVEEGRVRLEIPSVTGHEVVVVE
jgi:hypothetical protein